jgi:hypothetical protein
MRKKLAVVAFFVVLAVSVVAPALAAPNGNGAAPPGLHKAPAVDNVPASVCGRCHTG